VGTRQSETREGERHSVAFSWFALSVRNVRTQYRRPHQRGRGIIVRINADKNEQNVLLTLKLSMIVNTAAAGLVQRGPLWQSSNKLESGWCGAIVMGFPLIRHLLESKPGR
jgi:hypothetical protein